MRSPTTLSLSLSFSGSHISPPRDFVCLRMGGDVALEVDVVALLDVGLVKVRPEAERDHGRV